MVSAGCANCYAESLSRRNPAVLGEWGRDGTRVLAAESAWRQPLRWNRRAEREGVRRRVFCGHLCDVFEDRPELVEPRLRLFRLMLDTPHLDWMILTKRPEEARRMLNDPYLPGAVWDASIRREDADLRSGRTPDGLTVARDIRLREEVWPPRNVWIGVSVEDQTTANERIPQLLAIDAAVRFVSAEPLLGPVDLRTVAVGNGDAFCPMGHDEDGEEHCYRGVDWVICGGESGARARPMHPDWARGLRDQCAAAGVAFFFKQVGEWATIYDRADDPDWRNMPADHPSRRWLNLAGGRGFHGQRVVSVERVGKKRAGRELDGRTWDEYPEVR